VLSRRVKPRHQGLRRFTPAGRFRIDSASTERLTIAVPAAQAQAGPQSQQLSPIEKQEIGHANDPRLVNVGEIARVKVVGPTDSFDYADAGIGGATALSIVALLGAVALLLRRRRRGRSVGVAASSG